MVVTTFCQKLFVAQCRKNRSGILQCLNFSGYRKIFWKRKVCQDFSVENFLSHSTENLRNGTLLCSRFFLVSKLSLDQIVGTGDNQDFPSAFFRVTVPINFLGEPLCVSEFLRYRLKLRISGCGWGRGLSLFFVRNFSSQSSERARSGILQCLIISGYTKNLCFRKVCHDFLVKIFCLTVPKKNRMGTLLCFRIFAVSINITDNRVWVGGIVTTFRQKLFVAQCRKDRRGNF